MIFHKDGTLPPDDSWVFVFGSNEGGYHGAGSAKVANEVYKRPIGSGFGFLQNSGGMTFAIPTKDMEIKTLPIVDIEHNIAQFGSFVQRNPNMKFFITRVGCGLAGFSDERIAPVFASFIDGLKNISIPDKWEQYFDSFTIE